MNMSLLKTLLESRKSLPVFAAIGFLFLLLVVMMGSPPDHNAEQLHSQPVDSIIVQLKPLVPRALAYGSVEPDVNWQAIAEVSGRVTYMHPELHDGNTLAAGTEVLRIDSRDYELALLQAQAEAAAQSASLQQLSIEQSNTQQSLTIAQRSLEVAQSELSRKKRLLKQGSISQTQVDQEERNSLSQRLEVQNLSSQMDVFPSRIKVAQSQLALAQASVEEQQRNLERTSIRLPFDARIGSVNAEQDLFLSSGSALFDAYDLARVEIRAQLPMARMRPLVKIAEEDEGSFQQLDQLPLTRKVFESFSLRAIVRWPEAGDQYNWQGQVQRVGNTLDPTTRALTVVVSVEQPYSQAVPGVKPPLFKGMYMEVELQGPARELLVIPRFAIHHGSVYLVKNNLLHIQPITVDFVQGELAVVASGLSAGDQLVVDDLIPAVAGMPLNAVESADTQSWLDQLVSAQMPLNGVRP